MFGLAEAMLSFLRRSVGVRTDNAAPNGSLHAKVGDVRALQNTLNNNINARIGTSADTRASNTVLGFASSPIRSIQRGTITIAAAGATSATATISAVSTGKSMVLYRGFSTSGASFSFGTFPRVTLTSSTSVSAGIGSSAANNVLVDFEVVEYF